jgi:alkylation response protein AidB-like acyl-CoA dehydrogenase
VQRVVIFTHSITRRPTIDRAYITVNFDLNEEQKGIQKAASDFANGEFDKEVALELERNHQFPLAILKKACNLGFIGIHYPEEYGG